MSNSSRERHKQKVAYFDYLRDVATSVDPYVKNSINTFLGMNPTDSLKNKVLARYRFGKPQLRPAQVRIGFEIAGGDDWEKTIPAAAALEVKDTGYYCLDDFFDVEKDPTLPIIAGTFAALSHAMVQDLVPNYGFKIMTRISTEVAKLDISNAHAALIDFNLDSASPKQYLQKAEGYNFWEYALRIGGILAEATSDELNTLGKAGRNIGIGYIIANDTWDFGKNLSDFKAGKLTLVTQYALKNATDADRKILQSHLGNAYIDIPAKENIMRIYNRSGAIAHGKEVAKEYCDKGLKLLSPFPDSQAKEMITFATTTTQRNKYLTNLDKLS